jgi:hypothetical protein
MTQEQEKELIEARLAARRAIHCGATRDKPPPLPGNGLEAAIAIPAQVWTTPKPINPEEC